MENVGTRFTRCLLLLLFSTIPIRFSDMVLEREREVCVEREKVDTAVEITRAHINM